MLDANDLWFQFCVKHASMNDDSKIRTRSKYESSRIVAELSGWLNRETNRAFVRPSDSKNRKNRKNTKNSKNSKKRERKGTTKEVRDRGMTESSTCTRACGIRVSLRYVAVQTEARDNGYEEWIYQWPRVES